MRPARVAKPILAKAVEQFVKHPIEALWIEIESRPKSHNLSFGIFSVPCMASGLLLGGEGDSQKQTSHPDFSGWPGCLEAAQRRPRRPLTAPVGAIWTYAAATPTFRPGGGVVSVNAYRFTRGSNAPVRLSPNDSIKSNPAAFASLIVRFLTSPRFP